MIQISGLGLSFGGRTILDQVNLVIKDKDKIALIGRNGAGKTTLLKIIVKELQPDAGKINIPAQMKIAYLQQFIQLTSNGSILEETMSDFKSAEERENEIKQLQINLEHPGNATEKEYETWIHELNHLLESEDDEIKVRARAERLLKGLGLRQNQLFDPISSLSGGWKMRVELARILLSDPDLLLLDEPTNYLDIESIIWFESYLKNFGGSAIIISHDETFLDNTTNLTWSVSNGEIEVYPYSYSKSLVFREERRKIKESAYKNQQKVIQQKQRTVDRFRAKASKSRMAKSMEKQLNKIERIELDEYGSKNLRLKFNDPPRSGDVVLEVKELSKNYDENEVFSQVEFNLERGEKIALVGKNGEGKSTLIHLITGRINSSHGYCKNGHNVSIGVYYQDQSEMLDPSITAYETLEQITPFDLRPKLRGILGAFLFSGEDIEKKVQVLSGGEKSRLALASLLLKPYNFLILDEPTSHLDISSKKILKDALLDFTGTVIIVSHDRKFLQGLSDKTYELRDGKMHVYLGDIDYFLEKKSADNFREFELSKKDNTNSGSGTFFIPDAKESREKVKKLKRKIQYIEREIQKLETSIKDIEKKMLDSGFYSDPNHANKLNEHKTKKALLDEKHEQWDALVEELMILEQ